MGILCRISLLVVVFALPAVAQTPTTPFPPYPAGMRLLVGSTGVLVRNAPSLNATCGTDNHVCTQADAVLSGVYGVVQIDPPVFEPAGWWWVRVTYDTGITGWSSGYPPFLNALTPVQMAQGFNFQVVGDYNGPALTGGLCISDGVQSPATLNLQPIPGGTGQSGTMACPWTMPAAGNHITVITAVNTVASTPSTEFQFRVTEQVIIQPPTAPMNLRIAPVGTGATGVTGANVAPGARTPAPAGAKPVK